MKAVLNIKSDSNVSSLKVLTYDKSKEELIISINNNEQRFKLKEVVGVSIFKNKSKEIHVHKTFIKDQ